MSSEVPELRQPDDGDPEERPSFLAPAEGGTGYHVEGAQVQGLRGDVHLDAARTDGYRGGTLGGRFRPADEGLDYLKQAAREEGTPISDYLREAGILTEYDERQILKNEVPIES